MMTEITLFEGVSAIRSGVFEIARFSQNLEKTVNAILNSAWTGETGDGKIFVYDIEETYRIRTKESGPSALYNKE